MNSLEAQRTIIAKTEEVIALARRLYPTYTAPAPSIRFNLRGRSCGGKAIGYSTVCYNLDWYNVNPQEYLKNTVTHEIAHIVAAATGLGRGHNRGWVRICLALGGDGKRCNTHEDIKAVRKARQTNEYLYRTSSGREVWVGPVHHGRLQKRGGIMHPTTGKPIYALRMHLDGSRVEKSGYLGKSRLKA